jgi:hypothetical protein
MSGNSTSFSVLKYTSKLFENCHQAMNTSVTSDMSDAQTNELCCDQCKFFICWPLAFIFDILSCPIRGCMHIKNNRCSCKSTSQEDTG